MQHLASVALPGPPLARLCKGHPAPGGNGVAGLRNGRLPNRARPIGAGLDHMHPATHKHIGFLLLRRFEHRFSRTPPISCWWPAVARKWHATTASFKKEVRWSTTAWRLGRTSGTRGHLRGVVVRFFHEATAFLGRCATSTGNADADLPLGMTHKPPTKPRNAPSPRPTSLHVVPPPRAPWS
jgi:hypothetical protein